MTTRAPPTRQRSARTTLSIVANHAPSLAIRRFARWLNGLSRDQVHEFNAIAAWSGSVYFLSAVTMSYKWSEFVTACAFVTGGLSSDKRPDMCSVVNFFSSALAAVVVMYESYAGGGTPKGRGAFAAYGRRAARRQTKLLLLLTSPTLASNWFGCKVMRLMSVNNQRVGRTAAWSALAYGFRHGISNSKPPGVLSTAIITLRFAGEKFATRLALTAEELFLDILLLSLVAALISAYFMRRDTQKYGGLSAERRARGAGRGNGR